MAVLDSTLSDGGWVFPSGTAVLVHDDASAVRIEHNEITNFSYTAVSLGWTWSYARRNSFAANHVVRKNRIHHLGYPRRETGDAMACVYTLGQLNGTVIDGNVCHDVRAYMSGGYGLSQDQGSSNVVFTNNVCLRMTGSPHNTHYGVNLTYRNNVFYGGYWGSHTSIEPAGALRTSPSTVPGNCASTVFATACPDQITLEQNLIGQWANRSVRAVHEYARAVRLHSQDVALLLISALTSTSIRAFPHLRACG